MGLLGPNGAGKSTTMKMLTAQAIADRGEIDVLGDNLDTMPSAYQNLVVLSYLRDPARPAGRRGRTGAPDREPSDRRDSRVHKLSGGMRRRLLIARPLVHRPRLVLMNEPTVGLGPRYVRRSGR